MTTYEITSGNLVGEDSLSGSLSTNATTNSNVGTYTITSSLSNSNYNITYTNGTLTITPKAITVVANDVTKTYGDNNPNLTYSLDNNSSLVGEDSLSSLISGSLNTNATTNSNVGSYTVSTSNLSDITSNYDITFNDGTLTITPKAITVVANDVTKTYGDNNPNLTYEITSGNLVGEDSLSGSLSTNATTNSNVGTYTITSSLSNSNYDITYTNGTLTITPKAIIVVANDVSKTYGDNNPSLTYSLDSNSSLVGEDSLSSLISGSLNTNATTNSNVGSYTVSTSNLSDITSNYDITFNDGTLTITPKAIISQTSLPQQINQVTGIPLEVSQLLNNELISLGTNLLVLDKSNENVTTLALNGKLQPDPATLIHT